jgi:LuxR family transcriptional regulator, maltose regulon positive regulatory protein
MARKADRVARDYGADLEIAIAHAWMTRLRILRGDLAEVATLERRRATHAEGAAAAARVLDRITSARLLHARGRHREALRMLEEPREAAEANGRTRDLIEIMTLRALALWASNEKERAVADLTEALAWQSRRATSGHLSTRVSRWQNPCRGYSKPSGEDVWTHPSRRTTSAS